MMMSNFHTTRDNIEATTSRRSKDQSVKVYPLSPAPRSRVELLDSGEQLLVLVERDEQYGGLYVCQCYRLVVLVVVLLVIPAQPSD